MLEKIIELMVSTTVYIRGIFMIENNQELVKIIGQGMIALMVVSMVVLIIITTLKVGRRK